MGIFNRKTMIIVNYFLNNICPPFLRDCKYFMYPVIRFAFGRQTKLFLDFKEKFPFMDDSELAEYYRRIADAPIVAKSKTFLNKACLDWIVKSAGDITGTILDVGCGKGYLLGKIMESNPGVQCCGADIAPPSHRDMPIKIHEADIINLPFPDHSFDMVICTHNLEHIREPQKALGELIRVAKRRLIIVVPREREYRYSANFHVNFFPYMYSFKRFIGIENATYLNLKGDFLCCIDF